MPDPPIKAVAVAAILPQAGPVPFHPAPPVVRQSIILWCRIEVNVPGLVLSCTPIAVLEVIQSENGKKRRNAPPAEKPETLHPALGFASSLSGCLEPLSSPVYSGDRRLRRLAECRPHAARRTRQPPPASLRECIGPDSPAPLFQEVGGSSPPACTSEIATQRRSPVCENPSACRSRMRCSGQ